MNSKYGAQSKQQKQSMGGSIKRSDSTERMREEVRRNKMERDEFGGEPADLLVRKVPCFDFYNDF
jgi:hypothetical protein